MPRGISISRKVARVLFLIPPRLGKDRGDKVGITYLCNLSGVLLSQAEPMEASLPGISRTWNMIAKGPDSMRISVLLN